MKTSLLLILLIGTLYITGCHKDKPISTPTDSCQNLETFNLKDTVHHRDAFTLISDTVVGDDLKFTISYGGGCQQHNFKLVWNQYATPPFDVIQLEHNANGDLCKALITKQLCFNLSLLKQGQSHGETDFPFSDSNGKSVTIKYKY